jgi:nucleotide-binding universal stress UspA family protein
MDEALAVFDEDGIELLEEAGELAAGVDAHLTVLALMTEDEFDEVAETLDTVATAEHTGYGDDTVLNAAKQEAREAVRDHYGDLDLEWDVTTTVIDDKSAAADGILEAAEEMDADHVFLSGQQRSPTGKAVFGDRTQAVILNFDGPVTTLLD